MATLSLEQNSRIIYPLLVAVLLLAFFVFLKQRKSASRANALLLVGAPDAGKTAILTTLLYDQTLPSVTSLQTNSSIITLPKSKKSVRVIDVPGHPRIRDQFRDHIPEAKVIAFVVDASTVSRNGAVVAEHLHLVLHTLTSLPPSQTPPTLLVIAHKADVLKSTTTSSTMSSDSLAVTRVKTVLERELQKRKASQSGGVGVEGLGAEGERTEMGGLECSGHANAVFRFSDWEGGEIAFITSSVSVGKRTEADGGGEKGESGISSLLEWLEAVLP